VDCRQRKTTNFTTSETTNHKTQQQRGFTIDELHADSEFKHIEREIEPVVAQIGAAGECAEMVEKNVCTIKDRCRSIVNSTPYRRMPTLLCNAEVDRGTIGLNGFPSKTGISSTMSAWNILEGKPNLDSNTLSLSLGAYLQQHEGTTNTTKCRSVGAIALNPSNEQGRHHFMSLITDKKLHG